MGTINSTGNIGFPKTISIQPFNTPVSSVGEWDIFVSASYIKNGGISTALASPAQNDEIDYNVNLGPGTWTIELMFPKSTDRGIVSVQLDDVEVGTIDQYAASTSFNNLASVTGVAVSIGGKKELKLKMATKNASSSNYAGAHNGIFLRRTA